jgi:small subunit ribosomal protein S20
MPNKTSAKKYMRVTAKNTSLNNAYKKAFRKAIREVEQLIKEDKLKDAMAAFQKAQKALDKAAKAGIIKKNTASRKKSRLVGKIKKSDKK